MHRQPHFATSRRLTSLYITCSLSSQLLIPSHRWHYPFPLISTSYLTSSLVLPSPSRLGFSSHIIIDVTLSFLSRLLLLSVCRRWLLISPSPLMFSYSTSRSLKLLVLAFRNEKKYNPKPNPHVKGWVGNTIRIIWVANPTNPKNMVWVGNVPQLNSPNLFTTLIKHMHQRNIR